MLAPSIHHEGPFKVSLLAMTKAVRLRCFGGFNLTGSPLAFELQQDCVSRSICTGINVTRACRSTGIADGTWREISAVLEKTGENKWM